MESNKTKELIRIEQQFLYILNLIIESFPKYTISQHLLHFLRKKGDKEDPYFWSSSKLLRKLELYYDELKKDLIDDKSFSDLY